MIFEAIKKILILWDKSKNRRLVWIKTLDITILIIISKDDPLMKAQTTNFQNIPKYNNKQ